MKNQCCTCVIWSSSILASHAGRTASNTWRARSRVLRFPTRGTPANTKHPELPYPFISNDVLRIYWVVPEQHFCAAMFSSTSVHFGDAILDWMALEDTTLLRKTRKSPRCSSAVCCLRIKAGKTNKQEDNHRLHNVTFTGTQTVVQWILTETLQFTSTGQQVDRKGF